MAYEDITIRVAICKIGNSYGYSEIFRITYTYKMKDRIVVTGCYILIAN